MTNRSFKAKLIGSEILRSVKERTDSKADVVDSNPELNHEKNAVIDSLHARLVAVLEKEGTEKDSLIANKQKREQTASEKAADIYELFNATNDAVNAYRAAETRHRAQASPFGDVLDHHLSGLRVIKQELDAERSQCPCTVM